MPWRASSRRAASIRRGSSEPVTAPAPVLPYGSAELRAGDARVVIVPALGGKIVSLVLAGREWLWHDPSAPPQIASDDGAYREGANGGGYEELFPTVAPCTIPAGVTGFGGTALPDHGELWTQPSTFTIDTRDGGMSAVCGWRGRRLPYRLTRGTFVGPAGRVELRYALTNEGAAPLPFVWSGQALLPLTRATRLVLAEGARVRVLSQRGIELGGPGGELRWPRAVVGGQMLDLSLPFAVSRGYSATLVVDAPPGGGTIAVVEDDARLDIAFDAGRVPRITIGVHKPAPTLFRRHPPVHLSVAPGIGAPDSLADALGPWRGAAWVAPGETREWTVAWTAERRAPDAA